MATFLKRASEIWRDWTTAGVPASGAHPPAKTDIRQWGLEVETAVMALGTGASGLYVSKAALDASLSAAEHTQAWVIGDATVANNGIYRKVGAAGGGSWARAGDLPYAVIALSGVAGTANAITATTVIPPPSADRAALLLLTPGVDNTGAATLALNGGSALAIKGQAGEAMSAGYLKAGATTVLIQVAGEYRTINDFRIEALAAQAAASAAAAAADETAADGHRVAAAGSATTAAASAAAAAVSEAQASLNAEAAADIELYKTKAAADAALSGLANGQWIEVEGDESRSGTRTRYVKESGAYTFVRTLSPQWEITVGVTSQGAEATTLGLLPILAAAPAPGQITHVAGLCSRVGVAVPESGITLNLELLKNGVRHGSVLSVPVSLSGELSYNAALATALAFAAGDAIDALLYVTGGTQLSLAVVAVRGSY